MNKMISGDVIKYSKTEDLQTPCFIIDVPDFINNINDFKVALQKRFDNSIVAYSMKTNSLPYLLSLACANGCYAEVVSFDEYNLAKYIGYPIDHIVYNGPMKSKDTFLEALGSGAYVNIETEREIQWLKEYNGNKEVKLGIRVNIDLGEISPEDAKKGEEQSRFGFDHSNGELERAVRRITEYGFEVKGLHIHRTSGTRSLNSYNNLCRYADTLIRELKLDLSFVDVGGGYYGKMPGKPGYDEYVEVISHALNVDRSKVTIIVEPGNALTAGPIDYIMSVIDTKRVKEKAIVTCDGSRLDVDPFFHKKEYMYEIISENEALKEKAQIIAGCTCLENDIITQLKEEKRLEAGDRIKLKWEGAYTMALTPNFIRFLPVVYAYDKESYVPVRNKWEASELCQQSNMSAMPCADGYLFTNAGRRASLIKDFKKSLGASAKIVAADNWCVAPALFKADKYYLTPKINDQNYLDHIFNICNIENIKAITTCIDPEIELLAKNRDKFLEKGILPLCPSEETARLCIDKYAMYEYLKEKNIATILTYDNLKNFEKGYKNGEIDFPVFIKPRNGSASIGAEKIDSFDELLDRFHKNTYDYIIQEYMDCEDCDADVYIDTISHRAVAGILKKKIETRIGGASKTIAFKDQKLFEFIEEIVECFDFNGPVDMDFFFKNNKYYLSEINPRFGGAYLHAYGAGIDFPKLIRNNIHGIENERELGNYDDGSIMLMYDEVIMTEVGKLKGDYND